MADMIKGAIDMGADMLKDKVCSAMGGGNKTDDKDQGSAADTMAGMFGGGSKKDDKDQGFTDLLSGAAGKIAGGVAADKAADETKGMGSMLSNLAGKAAGAAAADQASEQASNMISGIFGK